MLESKNLLRFELLTQLWDVSVDFKNINILKRFIYIFNYLRSIKSKDTKIFTLYGSYSLPKKLIEKYMLTFVTLAKDELYIVYMH